MEWSGIKPRIHAYDVDACNTHRSSVTDDAGGRKYRYKQCPRRVWFVVEVSGSEVKRHCASPFLWRPCEAGSGILLCGR